MTSKECDIFLENVLEIGKRLVETGAEVHRVEDTVRRICIAYGFSNCEIYAVTSLIVATIKDNEGNHYTQSVRILSSGTDLGRMEELNASSRYICEHIPSVEELTTIVHSYKHTRPKPIIKCLGYMLAAGGFAVFFGGNWLDGIASAAVAIAIYFMDYHFKLRNINTVIYTFVASVASGCLALIFVHFGFGIHSDKVMIGDIMLFIPGLLLVSSVKEMFNRDIVTGLYRFIEAVLVAVAIACGFALSYVILGGVLI
ncbi:MAG: threonine/serine exporter family protein [Eubacterium sp.]